MKYTVIVEKSENCFLANCPVLNDKQARGLTIDMALENLQKDILLFLHDPDAEFEIRMGKN